MCTNLAILGAPHCRCWPTQPIQIPKRRMRQKQGTDPAATAEPMASFLPKSRRECQMPQLKATNTLIVWGFLQTCWFNDGLIHGLIHGWIWFSTWFNKLFNIWFNMWFDKWFHIWFNIQFNINGLIYGLTSSWSDIWFTLVYWDLDLIMILIAFFEMIPGLAGGLITFFLAGRMFSIAIIIGVVWQIIWDLLAQ